MPTIIYTDQVYHGHKSLETRIDTLLDKFDTIQATDYITEDDDYINFKGTVTINGITILTESILGESGIARYDHHLPTFTDNTALGVPKGTSVEQPSCGSPGYIRFNTTAKIFEGYDGNEWTRFKTTTLEENPVYAEEFTVNPQSYWEYDTWCLFGGETDARRRIIQLSMMDSFNGSLSQGMWVDVGNYATWAIKDKRFIRVYNKHNNSLQFFIKIM